ncbi:hypothetical protein [Pseudomonas citronellolis]|uniref:hypothetical protein n=1 Tax=Pseudomonas citronellolis TaxID=53408 RepID=UPI002D78E11E|nr:hypothetical protein [Pseudomonas citronellolis]WRT85571.1 hypothetical protein VK748_14390 [Pseudomonas citronellolis]
MDYRKMTQSPALKSITQGSVFNFARSEDFEGEEVLGLVISARCDLAQKKQDKFSYVPLIRASAWIDRYLVPKMFEEDRASSINSLGEILTRNNLSKAAIDTFGAKACSALIPEGKDKGKFLEILLKIEKIEQSLADRKFDKKAIKEKSLRMV